MKRLVNDQAQVENSGRVIDILRTYVIGNWNSEPHKQQQIMQKENIDISNKQLAAWWKDLDHLHTAGFLHYYTYDS